MISLQNQFIMVTGSSRGIGASIAKYLSTLGARLAITYSTSKESAQKIFQELDGSDHLLLQMNVTQPESVKRSFDQFINHFGSLSALVNNAGITKDGLLLRMKDEDFHSVLTTNLYGSFYCSREAAKYMIKERKGSIVNISSVVAQIGNPGQANYVASKAAIEGLTRSMANELAGRNIRVNTVAPGFIQTDMTERLNPKQVQAIADKIPLKKLGDPQDVAEAVAFLLNSRYITGQVISVNGGLAM